MHNLNEQLWAVAKEYARQFSAVIGADVNHWVGGTEAEVSLCCFGDIYFFSLAQMQQVVDNLPQLVARYGSASAVGDEIRAWIEWCIEDVPDDLLVYEVLTERTVIDIRPRISLISWLEGPAPSGAKPWDTDRADYERDRHHLSVIDKLLDHLRPDNTLADAQRYLRRLMSIYEEAQKNEEKH